MGSQRRRRPERWVFTAISAACFVLFVFIFLLGLLAPPLVDHPAFLRRPHRRLRRSQYLLKNTVELQKNFVLAESFQVPSAGVIGGDDLWGSKIATNFYGCSNASREFKITRNGLFKQLCQRMCPEISIFAHVTEEIGSAKKVEGGSSSDAEWDMLKREHRVYKYLCHYLVSRMRNKDCILEPIEASSTDNYPDESIKHTLEPSNRGRVGPSYWSSKGEDDPAIPEYLTYRLKSKLCVVTEIKIQPLKAFFQFNHPIYSSEAVRFRMGYSKTAEETKSKVLSGQQYNTDEKYIWTYVSPEFPMNQENSLQSFKLPRPVACTGGILQVELLRRVQKQEIDGLFYICICHVKVIGSNLSPVFDCDMPHESITSPVLKYFPDAKVDNLEDNESRRQSSWRAFTTRLKEFIF